MKLLHFADLHLGIENYGALNPRTGLSTRVDDFLAALERIIDAALAERVDAVLFAGDAFKNRDPNPTLQRAFAERIRRLAAAEIPTVLLIGNHDLPNITARATAIDIYEALAIPNIFVARNLGRLDIPTRSGPLQVVALPWVARNQFFSRDELRELDADEQRRRLAAAIAQGVRAKAEELDPEISAVLLAHVSVEGARLGSEQSIMLGHELVLSREELSADRFDYVALGHIHQHQVISTHPPIVYAGSPERIDFSEEREDKGYILVEIDRTASPGQPKMSFQPLPARAFQTLKLTAKTEDPMGEIERLIERRAADIEGAVVRLSVAVPADREELVRVDEVRRLLNAAGAAWIARVVRDVELQHRPRVDIRDEEALIPETMLARWLETRQLPDEQRGKVRDLGVGLIRTLRERENA